jgi:hypothetical protein
MPHAYLTDAANGGLVDIGYQIGVESGSRMRSDSQSRRDRRPFDVVSRYTSCSTIHQ